MNCSNCDFKSNEHGVAIHKGKVHKSLLEKFKLYYEDTGLKFGKRLFKRGETK